MHETTTTHAQLVADAPLQPTKSDPAALKPTATQFAAEISSSTPLTLAQLNVPPSSLHDLPHLTREPLARLWVELLRTPVPKSLSLPLMRRFVAFALQARDHGDLPDGFVATLAKRAATAGRAKPPPARLRPGGRLLREWNGITHVVDIVEDGFVWCGKPFASLSAIAKAITGAHWSGPRFFGLTAPAETGTTKRPQATGGTRAGRQAEPRAISGPGRYAAGRDGDGAGCCQPNASLSPRGAR